MVLYNLGIVRTRLGEYPEARRLLGLALEVWERVLPPDHPDIAETLFAYADVQDQLKQHKLASACRKRAETIRARHASANLMGLTANVNALH